MREGMFVLDSHVHVHKPFQSIWGVLSQTHEELIARMDRNGIDFSVIQGLHALLPEVQREQTEYIVEGVSKYPGRFIAVAHCTPIWGRRALEEMRWAHGLGVRGVKLYAHGQGFFPIDSPLLNPMIELAIELDFVVMIHTDIDSKVCTPFQGLILADRYPEAKIQFSHFGMNSDVSPFMADWCHGHRNVWLDTAASPGNLQFVYKVPMATMPDRLIFGSDGPTLYEEIELHKIDIAERDFGLTKDEKRKILGENAAGLYGIDLAAWYRKHGAAAPA
jgi:predicted TIM-barrel fold metal-dependent hydrolase